MAGDQGKRSSIQEEKGKGKRSSVQEHRGGEEKAPKIRKVMQEEMGKRKGKLQIKEPKIRKVTQEEMGKRKGKLQIKERDKPMELEKMRRMEGKVKKPFTEAFVTARVPERTINFYRQFLKKDFEDMYLKEECAHTWRGGLAQVRDMNNSLRYGVKLFKEFCTQRLEEYKLKGYLEYCVAATDAILHHDSGRIGEVLSLDRITAESYLSVYFVVLMLSLSYLTVYFLLMMVLM